MADPRVDDGVGILVEGDCASIVWQSAARVSRGTWMFDILNDHIAQLPGGVMMFQIILPTSTPPDKEMRAAAAKQIAKMGPKLRRIVTVPVGDAFWMSVVRTIMRTMFVLQGQRGIHYVADTVTEGVEKILEAKSPKTPPRAQISSNVDALLRALGEPVRASA